MKELPWMRAAIPASALLWATLGWAQTPPTPAPGSNAANAAAARHYTQSCTNCHGNPAVPTAPAEATLRQMTPESIFAALDSGAMREQAQDLPDGEKRSIAEYLAGRKLGMAKIADAKVMPNRCPTNPAISLSTPMWNGWGVDPENTRFQAGEGAGLTADRVPQLKLKWAFGFPGATVVFGQPTLAAGRVFLGVDTGYAYSIDAASGCVYWSFQALAGVRSPISVGPIERQQAKYAAYFGDIRGNVYAVDALTGDLLWKAVADAHPVARITGAPKLYRDRLYVPVSSMEEGAGGNPMYQCCTFRGSVVALDANTGREIWKTYTISEAAKPLRKNSQGVQLWGPAGGGVWDSPTIDLKRNAIYVGTGDAYSGTAPATTDAILALDMETGKILWTVQDTASDAWIGSCRPPHPSENCPDPLGPDYDFGTSPILKTLPDGHRLLVAGQKSGIVWAHDPDKNGALLWKTNLAPKPPNDQGEVVWGGAADGENAYFGLNSGGLAALQLATGERKWFVPLDPAEGMERHRGESGPVSTIPGVVFSGAWDGVLRAFSAKDGSLLWDYNTVREFQTVNEVPAKGGSMGATGPTIAGGMVFVGSGYIGVQNGMPGNVLLAFSVE